MPISPDISGEKAELQTMRKLEVASIVSGTIGSYLAIGIGIYQGVMTLIGGFGIRGRADEPPFFVWMVVWKASFYLLPPALTLLGLFLMNRFRAILTGSLCMAMGLMPTLYQAFTYRPMPGHQFAVLTLPALLCTASIVLHCLTTQRSNAA